VTVANLEFIYAVTVEPAVRSVQDFPLEHLELNLVRGDYLVVTNDSVNGLSDVVFAWGEEI
jgi:hypothetical protein